MSGVLRKLQAGLPVEALPGVFVRGCSLNSNSDDQLGTSLYHTIMCS